jgi:hypothetical protein
MTVALARLVIDVATAPIQSPAMRFREAGTKQQSHCEY